MGQLKPMKLNLVALLTSIILIVIFIPRPVQALCIGPEACGIIFGVWTSILTVPICLILFTFAIWPKTRPWLKFLALLPGLMTILTGYLMVIRVSRFDLIWIPLIHAVLTIVMVRIGRFDDNKESKNEDKIDPL
tara:strand:+ start:79 stop:480 length:402 start_codon:yes stop_codon:yes gene_type:complete